MHILLKQYLDACDLLDRANAERKQWGAEEGLIREEKLLLDGFVEIALNHVHAVRAELTAAIDRDFLPTFEWEPRQGSPYDTEIDPVRRQALVQEVADKEERRTIVRSRSGAIVATAIPSQPRQRLALTKAFGAPGKDKARPIGFGSSR